MEQGAQPKCKKKKNMPQVHWCDLELQPDIKAVPGSSLFSRSGNTSSC